MDTDSEKKLFQRIKHIEYQLEEINDKISKITNQKESPEENFERRLKYAEAKIKRL